MARQARCSSGHEFSPVLAVCPECGKPSRSGGRRGRFWLFILGGLALLGLLGFVLSDLYFMINDARKETTLSDYSTAFRHVCILQDAEARFNAQSGRFTSDPNELHGELELFFGPMTTLPHNSTFTLDNFTFTLNAGAGGYTISVVPVHGVRKESPSIYSDQTMIIRVSTVGIADASSPEFQLFH
jgi:hypothetical protein